MPVQIDNKQISPCICAKANFALGKTDRMPINNKTCRQEYWYMVVEYFGKKHNCSAATIRKAKGRTDLYRGV